MKQAIKAQTIYWAPQMPKRKTASTSAERRALHSAEPAKKITFEFTQDAGYIFQYQRLRSELPISMCGGARKVEADLFDAHSQILIARKGLHCLAGARLTISATSLRQRLPMEQHGLSLADMLPQLKLENRTYGEFSAFAKLPEFTDKMALPEIVRSLTRRAIAEGVEYIFFACTREEARAFQHASFLFAVRFDVMDTKLAVSEDHEGARPVLGMMDLTPLLPTHSKAAQEAVIAD